MLLFDGQLHCDTHMGELCDRVCAHLAVCTRSDMGTYVSAPVSHQETANAPTGRGDFARTGNQEGRALCSDSEELGLPPQRPVS
jgi:hypothetical protein